MISFFGKPAPAHPPIVFFNTLGKIKQEFKPLKGRYVKMYTCGPTVYDFAHIGNLRSYVFADILRRTLEYSGYEVKQVVNITDVGHLSSDADQGEDKMTAGLAREGMELTLANMKILAERYAEAFIADVKELNIELPFIFPRASDNIPEQIAFVKSLFDKGYAYTTSDGVYFDTGKFPKYGVLGGTSLGAGQSRVAVNSEKHHPQDFALWKFNPELGWDTPWGKGFPGWHIECTAMSTKYLGKTFDIHTGGMDHISIHHNNEIAQAEAATGKTYVNYWLHNEFITIEGQKISKSLGNTVTLKQLKDRDISPIAFRYWLLTGHYRSPLNFTWDSVQAAHTALYRALRIFTDLQGSGGKIIPEFRARFEAALYDDLNTAEAVAVMWELLKDEKANPADKIETLKDFDRVLGIGFTNTGGVPMEKITVVSVSDLPPDVAELVVERDAARNGGDWARADTLRIELANKGFSVEDSKDGTVVRKL